MRTAIVVIVIILAIVLLGGVVNLGGAPIFSHVDSVLGTDVLMTAHNTVFFFLHRAQQRIEEQSSKTGEYLKKFQEEPLGIEKKGGIRSSTMPLPIRVIARDRWKRLALAVLFSFRRA